MVELGTKSKTDMTIMYICMIFLLTTPLIETTIRMMKSQEVSARYHCYFLREKHFKIELANLIELKYQEIHSTLKVFDLISNKIYCLQIRKIFRRSSHNFQVSKSNLYIRYF